ncbi:MAG TPA: hypothetical protein PKA74_09240 [Bauldia sp.]|nr:hypothetical protein [Bauldia sp.]
MLDPSAFFRLATAGFGVALESQAVIGLRLAGFALGTARPDESMRMQSEKVAAFFEAQREAAREMLAGHPERSPGAALSVYRRRVRANRRRLTRR